MGNTLAAIKLRDSCSNLLQLPLLNFNISGNGFGGEDRRGPLGLLRKHFQAEFGGSIEWHGNGFDHLVLNIA